MHPSGSNRSELLANRIEMCLYRMKLGIKEGITMKQKFFFFVVLSMFIAICLPLTGCLPKAVDVDEQAAKEAVVEPVAEQATKPAAKLAAEQVVEEVAAKEAVAEPVAEQVVEEVAAKEAEVETAAEPVAEQAAAKTAVEDQEVKQSVAEPAAKPSDLEITRAAICRQVVDREPVDAGTSFESPVEKLSCFTHVTGAQNPVEIYHVWYFAEAERAVVKLKVNSVSWRTYSTKIIQPHEIGDWRVDVLEQEGNLLKAVHFKITP
jgi:hypothetical protein